MAHLLKHPPIMKWIGILTLAFSVGLTGVKAQDSQYKNPADTLRSMPITAYSAGEKLEYVLHYGIVNAGIATLEVKSTNKKLLNRELLQVVGTGKSVGAFNWFFKVRDRYESYIDKQGAFPWIFVRRVDEGGYKINQDYSFYQHQGKVDNGKNKQFDVPVYTQDMLSAFYYARTINFDTAKVGDIFTIQAFVDDELWPLKIKYMGKDEVDIRNGKFRCLRFVPVVQKGRIFKNDEDLSVWISDDKNKIPVLVQAKVLVGSIKMELTDYSGLANPIAKKN